MTTINYKPLCQLEIVKRNGILSLLRGSCLPAVGGDKILSFFCVNLVLIVSIFFCIFFLVKICEISWFQFFNFLSFSTFPRFSLPHF